MHDRKLMRLDPGGLAVHAELGHVATFHCNDMVVDRHGRAYVGNFGFDLFAGETPQPTSLARARAIPTARRTSPRPTSCSRTAR